MKKARSKFGEKEAGSENQITVRNDLFSNIHENPKDLEFKLKIFTFEISILDFKNQWVDDTPSIVR